MMAGSGNAAFVSKGFANWKDATISFQRMTAANVARKLLKRWSHYLPQEIS